MRTNEELVTEIQEGRNVCRNLTALWLQNEGLINKLARKYSFLDSFEDVKQEIFFIMRSSAELYDGEKGVLFSSYFTNRVLFLLARNLRNSDLIHIPARTWTLYQKYKTIAKDRELTLEEIREELDIKSNDMLETIIELDMVLNRVSLSTPVKNDENEDTTIGDMLISEDNVEEDVTEKIYKEELSADVSAALDELKPFTRMVVVKHFYEEKNLREISRETGDKYHKISWAKAHALDKLRANKRLYQYAQQKSEEIELSPYTGTGLTAFRNNDGTSSVERYVLHKENQLERLSGTSNQDKAPEDETAPEGSGELPFTQSKEKDEKLAEICKNKDNVDFAAEIRKLYMI